MATYKLVIKPAGYTHSKGALFSGSVEGFGTVVKHSRTPLFDAARELISRPGVKHRDKIEMYHVDDNYWAMRAQIGVAAKLTVAERDWDRIRLSRWTPRPGIEEMAASGRRSQRRH